MRRLTIGKQVGAGFAACLIGLVIVALVGTLTLRSVAAAKDEVIEERLPEAVKVHTLETLFATKVSTGRGYVIVGDESLLAQIRDLDERFDATLTELRATADVAVASELDEVATADDAWDAALDEVVSQRRRSGSADGVSRQFQDAMLPAYEQVRDGLRAVSTLQQQAIAADTAASERKKDTALGLMWLLVGLTLATGLLLAVWVTRRVSGQLTELAVRVEAAARELLAGVSQQVSGAAQQAAAVQETVATVEELVQTAEQAVDRAQAVADKAQESADVASAGERALEESNDGMLAIRDQMTVIAQTIRDLTQRAQAIGGVVGTVQSIAGETHLLALNAAIEAARAGDQGRGFAVVAGEVRTLAEQSREATGHVTEILVDIERGTGSAVMATEEGTKSTQVGTDLIAQTRGTIQELSQTIAAAAIAAEQIAASSRQQAAATVQISEAMRNVDTVMDQNVAAARTSEDTAVALNEAASQMKRLVGAG